LTLRLDEELYRAARSRALAENRSLNSVLNTLLRAVLSDEGTSPARAKPTRTVGRRKLAVSRGARRFTGEDVARIEMSDLADQSS